jgi:hypothetical protein
MTTTKTVTHPAASTVQVAAPSGSPAGVTITVTQAATSNVRIWLSTDPLVSVYPWYGTAASVGKPATVSALPGQGVYTYTTEPAQYTVTIA